ncbi:MAG: hypothetical protein K5888_09755 [Lachnospiraceae bacterium]|nr:hypothetical protein [Lachnospiraceae bacterium]
METKSRKKTEYCILCALTVLVYLCLMWIFTGNGPYTHNTYNSYALQADSWRHGRLDLGENYYHLELAEYKGKYYVSFPPFPSYVLFPLTFLFGSNTPDAMVIWAIDIVTIVYLYKLALLFIKRPQIAALTSLFVMLGTNVTFNMLNPWVWFIAQTMCFALSVMSVYYAYKGKNALSLAFWACSVGCRPMQAVFIPVLLYIIYTKEKEKDPEIGLLGIIKKNLLNAIPTVLIAFSYMLLNFLRFDNPLEFGHNYLPEFVEAEHGQFDIFYFSNDLRLLLNIPEFDENGRMVIDHFGNLNFLIVSPFVLFAVAMVVLTFVKKEYRIALFELLIIVLCVVYMIITMMHKTMGGWHFGNRYSNDILPWLFLVSILGLKKVPEAGKYQVPLMVFGMCLNAVGLVVVYNNMYIM